VAIPLHQLAAAIYLVAGLAAGLGLALPAPRLGRAAVLLLAAGALVHGACFVALHSAELPPPLTNLPMAMSFTAWVGALFFLLLLLRAKLAGLVVLVAPLIFLAVFFAALRLPAAGPATFSGSGSWPHAHVLLASGGLALLGVAGLAGVLFLIEHRRLKAKQRIPRRLRLPTLEALDRVNVAALALGFPLLTLGVLSGVIWLSTESGRLWTASPHETWSALAWAVYAVLVGARFGAQQGARQAAVSAVGGFAFLLFAVVGVEILT
jgi:ABC-type transport system involved in cytochrome c biogenesis permease subunit